MFKNKIKLEYPELFQELVYYAGTRKNETQKDHRGTSTLQ